MLQESDRPQAFQPSANPDFNVNPISPIRDDIDDIFESSVAAQVDDVFSQSDTSSDSAFKPELVANLDSRKLYAVGSNILAARKYRMDTQFFTHSDLQNNFIGSVAKVIFGRELPLKRLESLDEGALKVKESRIGATIFGPMAPNEKLREFFFDTRIGDRDSWFFHQVVQNRSGLKDEVTLHYEVHPVGVLRISSDPAVANEFISGKESLDFTKSASIYLDLVSNQLYGSNSDAGDRKAA